MNTPQLVSSLPSQISDIQLGENHSIFLLSDSRVFASGRANVSLKYFLQLERTSIFYEN